MAAGLPGFSLQGVGLLKGSWDLVSKVISEAISNEEYITLLITLVTKSRDPPSRVYAGTYQDPPSAFEWSA